VTVINKTSFQIPVSSGFYQFLAVSRIPESSKFRNWETWSRLYPSIYKSYFSAHVGPYRMCVYTRVASRRLSPSLPESPSWPKYGMPTSKVDCDPIPMQSAPRGVFHRMNYIHAERQWYSHHLGSTVQSRQWLQSRQWPPLCCVLVTVLSYITRGCVRKPVIYPERQRKWLVSA